MIKADLAFVEKRDINNKNKEIYMPKLYSKNNSKNSNY